MNPSFNQIEVGGEKKGPNPTYKKTVVEKPAHGKRGRSTRKNIAGNGLRIICANFTGRMETRQKYFFLYKDNSIRTASLRFVQKSDKPRLTFSKKIFE